MDAGEFEQFAAAAMPRLQRIALVACGGDAHEANDLVQACLERVLVAWPKQQLAHPFAYARAVLVHELASQRRRVRWKRERLTDQADIGPAFQVDFSGQVADNVTLIRALAALPPRQRHIIVLRYLEDLPVNDVATLLRCRPGTVKRASHVGLRTLRNRLTAGTEALGVSAEALGMGEQQ